jgi:S-adenosylmethionine-diacylglycerol 3-amino-3-carboxypropyl transferase
VEKSYFFGQLNYAYINEDLFVERAVVQQLGAKSIASVCGSGLRGLGLITPETQRLTLIDLSPIQLQWAAMRERCLRELSFREYLDFWGVSQTGQHRLILRQIAPELADQMDGQNLLTMGQWERTFVLMSKVIRKVIGHDMIQSMIEANLQQQREMYFSRDFRWKWKVLTFLMGNKKFFNTLLYKGDFVKKNIDKSYYQFYLEVFDRLFARDQIKDSFFLQLLLTGRFEYFEKLSPDFSLSTFKTIKNRLNSDLVVHYIQDHVISWLKDSCSERFDFIGLSDVPSYFNHADGVSFLQNIRPVLNDRGVVVVRYYLRICEPKLDGFKEITSQFQNVIESEKVGVYQIKIYQKIPYSH